MLDAIEETSRVTESADTLVDQFMFAFVHRNGPQVLMYMDEPLRRQWVSNMHPTWRFWGSSPWFEAFETTRKSELKPGVYHYDLRVRYGAIGAKGERVTGFFPMALLISRHADGWYLVDKITGYPPFDR